MSTLLGRMQGHRRLAAVVLAALLLVLVLPSFAFGYATWSPPPEPWTSATCESCHGADPVSTADGAGPHAGYLATTNKCVLCHDVHGGPAEGLILLRGPTVAQTCLMCHDGTATKHVGPYESIGANGGSVAAEHSYEFTGAIPGGSVDLDHNLYCSDCHSVHGANTVTPFLTDSTRPENPLSQKYVTDNLLKATINGKSVLEYGSLWCAACHDERHAASSGAIRNHPVEALNDPSYGEVVSVVSGADWIGMGHTNAGYIMPPVPASGDGRVKVRHDPLCQQCHEDQRNVEVAFSADYYNPNTATSTNPAFLTFPHQATSRYFLVEQNDDLCLNCHQMAG